MKHATLPASATLAVLLAVSGCGSSSSSSSPASSPAASSPAATAAPKVEATAGGMRVSQGDRTASLGKGTAEDVKESGLPLYPGVEAANTSVVKGSDANGKSIAINSTTLDDFDTVDKWYASRLGPDYQPNRLHFGAIRVTSFKKGTGPNMSSVVITAAKDPRGVATVSIMLLSKSKP